MNGNIKKIFESVESGMNAHHSAVTEAYEDYRKRVAMVKEEAAYYKDEEGELSRRKAALVDFNRQRIEAADKHFADTVKVAAAQLRKEMSENLRRPANPKLLDQLRTYADFGLKMTRAELQSYIDVAGGNYLTLRAIKAVAEQSGFTVTLPGGFEEELNTLEALARVPSMWCDHEHLAEAMEVLPDCPHFRDDGTVAYTTGRPDTVYLLTRAGLCNSAAEELKRAAEKWGTHFVPEISEFKPVEDPATGKTISPEEQHTQAVKDAADAVDIKTVVSEMRSDKSGQSILDIYK